MKDNKLQLNGEKTELLMITPSQQPNKVDVKSVRVCECNVIPSSKVHNHEATFDEHMNHEPHVSSTGNVDALAKSTNFLPLKLPKSLSIFHQLKA